MERLFFSNAYTFPLLFRRREPPLSPFSCHLLLLILTRWLGRRSVCHSRKEGWAKWPARGSGRWHAPGQEKGGLLSARLAVGGYQSIN